MKNASLNNYRFLCHQPMLFTIDITISFTSSLGRMRYTYN